MSSYQLNLSSPSMIMEFLKTAISNTGNFLVEDENYRNILILAFSGFLLYGFFVSADLGEDMFSSIVQGIFNYNIFSILTIANEIYNAIIGKKINTYRILSSVSVALINNLELGNIFSNKGFDIFEEAFAYTMYLLSFPTSKDGTQSSFVKWTKLLLLPLLIAFGVQTIYLSGTYNIPYLAVGGLFASVVSRILDYIGGDDTKPENVPVLVEGINNDFQQVQEGNIPEEEDKGEGKDEGEEEDKGEDEDEEENRGFFGGLFDFLGIYDDYEDDDVGYGNI